MIEDLEAKNGARDGDWGSNENGGDRDSFDPVNAVWNRVIEVIVFVVVGCAEVCLPAGLKYHCNQYDKSDQVENCQGNVGEVDYLSQVDALRFEKYAQQEEAYGDI